MRFTADCDAAIFRHCALVASFVVWNFLTIPSVVGVFPNVFFSGRIAWVGYVTREFNLLVHDGIFRRYRFGIATRWPCNDIIFVAFNGYTSTEFSVMMMDLVKIVTCVIMAAFRSAYITLLVVFHHFRPLDNRLEILDMQV